MPDMLPRLALLLFVVFEASGTRAAEAPFEVREIRTEHPVVQDPVPTRLGPGGSRHLLVVTSPDDAQIVVELFAPDETGSPSTTGRRLVLPPDVVAFDVARVDDDGREALFFLTPKAVLRFDPATGGLRDVRRVTSIYRRPVPGRLLEVDFMRDRDGAEPLLVLPDFESVQVGSTTLPVAAQAHHREGSTIYRPVEIHLADVTLDGTDDIFLLDDDTLRIFAGTKGSFSTSPTSRRLGLDVTTNRRPEELGDRDQSKVTTRRVIAWEDFDGDGKTDLMIESARRSGVFERETEHELHLGVESPDGLAYATEPSTTIRGDAPLGGLRTADIDGDGRLDVTAGSIDVGIGTIVSALLTGSVDVDVRFFRLGSEGYPDEPNVVREARIEFDLSEGSASIPVLVLADVDGDGDLDLIVREDENELLVYPANGTDELFDEDAISMPVRLPQNGQLVRRARLNGDDADDLVMYYERLSGAEAQRTVTLLLGRRLRAEAARPGVPVGDSAATPIPAVGNQPGRPSGAFRNEP